MTPDPHAPAGAQERALRQAAIDAERAAIPPVCDLPPGKYGCELYKGHEGPCKALTGTPDEVSWFAPQPQPERAALVKRLGALANRLEGDEEAVATVLDAIRALTVPAEATERPAQGEAREPVSAEARLRWLTQAVESRPISGVNPWSADGLPERALVREYDRLLAPTSEPAAGVEEPFTPDDVDLLHAIADCTTSGEPFSEQDTHELRDLARRLVRALSRQHPKRK